MNSVAERFWSKVGETSDTDCQPWLSATNAKGYGLVHYKRRSTLAHRVAWELTQGPIPTGLCVLHRCDNPACCNPTHLFLGTNRDNVADRHAKGRNGHLPGEHHGRAKLTNAQAHEIRERYAAGGVSLRSLAADYGVHNSRIGRIVKGQAYNAAQES